MNDLLIRCLKGVGRHPSHVDKACASSEDLFWFCRSAHRGVMHPWDVQLQLVVVLMSFGSVLNIASSNPADGCHHRLCVILSLFHSSLTALMQKRCMYVH